MRAPRNEHRPRPRIADWRCVAMRSSGDIYSPDQEYNTIHEACARGRGVRTRVVAKRPNEIKT
eukprot:1891643-Prymnesium_polylepis.1